VAATDGSQNAATLELADGSYAVMAIGGFNNEGGNLSLAQFEKYVKAGDIHYYIASGAGGGFGAGRAAGGGARTSSTTGSSSSVVSSLFGGSAGGGGAGGGGASSGSSAITTWVEAHFHEQTIGGETVYNLTDPS
jgi:hypothetical protein